MQNCFLCFPSLDIILNDVKISCVCVATKVPELKNLTRHSNFQVEYGEINNQRKPYVCLESGIGDLEAENSSYPRPRHAHKGGGGGLLARFRLLRVSHAGGHTRACKSFFGVRV